MSFDPLLLDKAIVLPKLDVAKMIFSRSVKKVLPGSYSLEATREGFCFRGSFEWDGPLPPAFLSLVQEEMRGIKKEGMPLKRMEMLLSNAAAFLSHHDHELKASVITDLLEFVDDEVTPFIRLGDDIEGVFGDTTLETTEDMGVVQLLSIEEKEDGYFEVLGTAFADDKEAKAFAKAFKEEAKRKEKDLLYLNFLDNKWLLTPQAIEKKEHIFATAREEWKTFGYQEVYPLEALEEDEWEQAAFELTLLKIAPCSFSQIGDLGFYFGGERDLPRFVTFVTKWLEKSAPFPFELEETKIRGGGKRLEWKFIDAIGMRLPGAFIEMRPMMRFSSPKKELLCHPISLSLIGDLASWLS